MLQFEIHQIRIDEVHRQNLQTPPIVLHFWQQEILSFLLKILETKMITFRFIVSEYILLCELAKKALPQSKKQLEFRFPSKDKVTQNALQRYFCYFFHHVHTHFFYYFTVADLYKLSSFDKVTVTKVSKSQEALVLQSASADFVTVTIKDQFICRGEMFHVQKFLMGKWMYEGERIHTPFVSHAYTLIIKHFLW